MQLLQRELEQQLYAQVKLRSAFDKQLQYLLLLAINKVDSNLSLPVLVQHDRTWKSFLLLRYPKE